MTDQTCALPCCHKPRWPCVRQGDSPAMACGNLHHQLLMAGRLNPGLPHHYQAILDRNTVGLCALASCEKSFCMGHSWCSRTHYLLWLREFISSLDRGQICMFPGCTRHVYVDENSSASRFCGWRHEQKFVMRSSFQQEAQRSVEVQQPMPSVTLNESQAVSLPSLKDRMRVLEQFALHGIAPKSIRVIEDFYEMHPWEVCTGVHACWFIAGLKFTMKKRRLTTKGPYHWKQSGPRAKKSKDITGKYYTYAKRKGMEKEDDQQQGYTMQEYTAENVKCYSLIHLVKERPSSDGKLVKEQCSKQETAKQVNNLPPLECFPDTGAGLLPLWNDDVSGDSIYSWLPPLDDFLQDFHSYHSLADPGSFCLTG